MATRLKTQMKLLHRKAMMLELLTRFKMKTKMNKGKVKGRKLVSKLNSQMQKLQRTTCQKMRETTFQAVKVVSLLRRARSAFKVSQKTILKNKSLKILPRNCP